MKRLRSEVIIKDESGAANCLPCSLNAIPTLVIKRFHKQILDLLAVGIFMSGLILFKALTIFQKMLI